MAFFADLGRFPEAVILPSRPVGGVWLRDYLLCLGVLVFDRTTEYANSWERGGGGLNCEVKAQVLVVTPPPPLFFLKVGHKKGGRNSRAVRYIAITVLVAFWVNLDDLDIGFMLNLPRSTRASLCTFLDGSALAFKRINEGASLGEF